MLFSLGRQFYRSTLYTHTLTHIYVCVCVCVCVYLGSIFSLIHISLNNIEVVVVKFIFIFLKDSMKNKKERYNSI